MQSLKDQFAEQDAKDEAFIEKYFRCPLCDKRDKLLKDKEIKEKLAKKRK